MSDYEILPQIHLGQGELGRQRREALEALAAEAGYYWNDKPSIGRWLVVLADERIEAMKAKDLVYCPQCGEEYDRFRGHTCDLHVLAELAQAEADDAEVREQEED